MHCGWAIHCACARPCRIVASNAVSHACALAAEHAPLVGAGILKWTRPSGRVHRRSQALRGSSPPPSVRTLGPVGREDGGALVSRDSYTEMAVLRVRLAAPRFTGIKDAPHGSTGVTAIRCLHSDNLCDNDSHVVLVPCTPLASRANSR